MGNPNLAKHRCDVTYGGTILHMAAVRATSTQVLKVLELLVNSGADIKCVDGMQRTLLLVCQQQDLFRFLIEMGADTRHRDLLRRNCWHFATAEVLN